MRIVTKRKLSTKLIFSPEVLNHMCGDSFHSKAVSKNVLKLLNRMFVCIRNTYLTMQN